MHNHRHSDKTQISLRSHSPPIDLTNRSRDSPVPTAVKDHPPPDPIPTSDTTHHLQGPLASAAIQDVACCGEAFLL